MTADSLSQYWPVFLAIALALGGAVSSASAFLFGLLKERREEKKASSDAASARWDRLQATYSGEILQLEKLSDDPANPNRVIDHRRLLDVREEFVGQISAFQDQQALRRLVPPRSRGEGVRAELDQAARAELSARLRGAMNLTAAALDADDYRAQGDAAYQLGRLSDSLVAYDRALALRPHDPYVLAHRGRVLRRLGRPAEAVSSYSRALELLPNNAIVLAWRAHALRKLGREQEALADLDRAYALEPQDIEVLKFRSQLLRYHGREAEADELSRAQLELHNRALSMTPNDPFHLSGRSGALGDLARYDEALADEESVALLWPDDPDVLGSLGWILMRLRRYEEALAYVNRALSITPDDPDSLGVRGFLLVQLGRCEEALDDLNLSLATSPDDIEVLGARARAFAKLGLRQEALADIDHAIAIRPTDPAAMAIRASLVDDI